MRTSGCAELAETASELVLGILPGDERADAVAHLDECSHCQQLVGSYTMVSDQLLLLAARVEPPPGFDSRVLAAITADEVIPPPIPLRAPHPTARRRVPGAVLAVAACIAVLFGALFLLGVVGPSSSPAIAEAEMRTAGDEVVGEIFVHDGPPAHVFMNLPGWHAAVSSYDRTPPRYSLLITRSRRPPLVVPVRMSARATWAADVAGLDAGDITSAALLDSTGHVWCSATF
jgi:hypothetical protein